MKHLQYTARNYEFWYGFMDLRQHLTVILLLFHVKFSPGFLCFVPKRKERVALPNRRIYILHLPKSSTFSKSFWKHNIHFNKKWKNKILISHLLLVNKILQSLHWFWIPVFTACKNLFGIVNSYDSIRTVHEKMTKKQEQKLTKLVRNIQTKVNTLHVAQNRYCELPLRLLFPE